MVGRNREVDITAVIRARDETRTAMQSANRNTQSLTRSFGNLNGIFSKIGLGAIGVGTALTGLIRGMDQAASAEGNLAFRIARLPESVQVAFAKLRPLFAGLGFEFGKTTNEIEGILLAIAESTGEVSDMTEANLRAALGFEALGFGADLFARALAGDEEAIRTLTGNFQSFEDAVDNAISMGPDAVSVPKKFFAAVKQEMENLAVLADALSKGNFGEIMEFFTAQRSKEFEFVLNMTSPVGILKNLLDGLGKINTFSILMEVIPDEWAKRIDKWIGSVQEISLRDEFTPSTWLKRVLFFILAPGLVFKLSDIFTSSDWLSRIWGWVNGGGVLFNLSDVFQPSNWAKRIWGWASGDGLLFNLTDNFIVSGMLGTLLKWIDDGIEIAIRFTGSLPLPGFLGGGGSGGSPISEAPLPELTGGAGPSPPPSIPTSGTGTGALSPGLDEGIRGFATGGVFRTPTIARIAEAGPEAVVPLNNSSLDGMGAGTNLTVNIYGDIDSEIRVRDIVRKVERLLTENGRRGVGI